ncbi:MAG: HAMP domain-containing protein [Thermoanaerobaculia bacterium]|nr:MAG: HAMP domain-containing protein [Thermoanaerobaculia bacterium]
MPTAPAEAASRRLPPSRLASRLALVLSMGAAAILVAAGYWHLASQRRQLTQIVQSQADGVVEVVRGATRESMLRNDSAELARIIDTLAAQEPIDRVRVFDKQGRITHSSAPAEIGHQVDATAEQCVSCHAEGGALREPARAERARIFSRPGEGRTLGLIAPIRNERACSTSDCHAHDPSQTVLGVLDVQMPLAGVDAAVSASQRQLLVGLVATVAAVVALAFLLAWLFVLRPVGALTAAAPLLAAGDFSARVPESSRDELGDLARAWNRMAADLGSAHAELAEWGNRLAERVEEKTRELEATHQTLMRVEKMASLGKLAASVAHELNNPLAGIATYARLLRRRREEAVAKGSPVTPGDDNVRILKMVEEEALRCGDIVRNLLLFSRMPGALIAPAELGPIVERCLMLVRHQAQLAGVELAAEIAAGVPAIECDAAQIHQALLAMVINALEATPEGGRVSVAAAPGAAGRVRLTISDSGRGIPPEVIEHVFEPFFTTKPQGSGVGLGLAIVYGIVERHHGTIDVKSKPGSGTVFTVELPVRQPAVPAAAGTDRRPA